MQLKALILVGALASTLSAQAFAGGYYSRDLRCDRNAGRDAVVGGLIGVIGGAILGGQNGNAGEGAAIGGALGASIGLGLNCEQEVSYYRHCDDYLGRGDFSRRYDWDNGYFYGGEVVYLRGARCIRYTSVLFTPRGIVETQQISCQDRRGWGHERPSRWNRRGNDRRDNDRRDNDRRNDNHWDNHHRDQDHRDRNDRHDNNRGRDNDRRDNDRRDNDRDGKRDHNRGHDRRCEPNKRCR